ncbi:hypothetical protein LZ30DRAFT_719847 [Colletotrichum cereale]|nr:hypothetical protein LZ30DRAFT_719847 [Colletotrichum cereale]
MGHPAFFVFFILSCGGRLWVLSLFFFSIYLFPLNSLVDLEFGGCEAGGPRLRWRRFLASKDLGYPNTHSHR